MPNSRLTPWARVIVGVWVALALIAIYDRGRDVGVDRHVTSRLRFHALPVAMSVLYHGRAHDYTAYRSLAMAFQSTDPIDERLAWAVDTYKPPEGDSAYYWLADDRGMADYAIAAFALFGPRESSLYKFYFIVLGLSALLLLLDLGWHPVVSALSVFALAALYVCVSVIPLGNAGLPVRLFEPGALYEPRVIELLSYLATLHLACAAFVEDRWKWHRIALVGGQAAILAGCYHARSSIGWEVLFVLAAGAAAWIYRARTWRRRRPPMTLIAVAAALTLMTAYHRYAYNPRYFEDMGSRTIWHNALMGLGANDHLRRTYDLGINDRSIVYAVMAHLRDTNSPLLTANWTGENILGSLGGHAFFDWFAFEDGARRFYWHLWRAEPASMLRCYAIDKPQAVLLVLWKAWRGEAIDATGDQRFDPLTPIALLIALPGLVIGWASRARFRSSLAAVLGLLAFSLVPGLLFYPVVHAMMGVFATLALTLYVASASLVPVVAPYLPALPVPAFVPAGLTALRRRLPGTRAEWIERVEPALVVTLVVMTCLTCAYFAPRGFRAGFSDMAHDGYQLRQVLDLDRGGTIFKDTFDQYGPLSGYVNLVSFKLLGRTLLAIKYGVALWYGAIAFLLYRLARRLLPIESSVLAVLVWLVLAPFYQHGIMISPHVYLLFFQAVAVLALIRFADTGRMRYAALVGVCCGLGWALKTSVGAFFALGLIAYVLTRPLRGVSTVRQAVAATATIAACAALVAAVLLAWLWMRGALGDWYVQTVAFPRAFYFDQDAAERTAITKVPAVLALLWGFLLLNLGATGSVVVVPLYWHAIRASAVIAAGLAWRRRDAPEALFVIACLTPALWLGAYPSANYMHQWWTASLTIPAFVYAVTRMVDRLALRWSVIGARRVAATAVVVVAAVSPGVAERVAAARERTRTLSATIEAPRVLRGIHTDPQTAAAFRAIYEAMANFKRHHPSARVVSNDHCDGFSNCVPESLLWLSFLDDNVHDHPVYWPLPVLTTRLYPGYDAAFWDDVRRTQPLIVDSWPGNYLPEKKIDGYRLLVGLPSENSYWYVFAPDHAEAAAHGEASLRIDRRGPISQTGAPRLFDQAVDRATGAAIAMPLYTWPADLEVPLTLHEPRPIEAREITARAAGVSAGKDGWIVRGEPESRYAELLSLQEATVADGDYFLATGHLEEGGFSLQLIGKHELLGQVVVPRRGPFAVMLKPPAGGQYRIALVSHLETRWWQIIERDGLAGIGRLKNGAARINVFRVNRAGWVTPAATTPVAFTYQPPGSHPDVDSTAAGVPAEGERWTSIDRATGSRSDVYRWPAGAPTPATFGSPAIDAQNLQMRAAIVTGDRGRWTIRGDAEGAYSYLLQFRDETVEHGGYFLAQGRLEAGGVTFGLLRDGQWAGFVNVDTPGPFTIVLMPPERARYSLVLANYNQTRWWQVVGRLGLPGVVKLMTGTWRPVSLEIERAGWVAAQ